MVHAEHEAMSDLSISPILDAAALHGDEPYDKFDEDAVPRAGEIGDLVDVIQILWGTMTPEQRAAAYPECVEVVADWMR